MRGGRKEEERNEGKRGPYGELAGPQGLSRCPEWGLHKRRRELEQTHSCVDIPPESRPT